LVLAMLAIVPNVEAQTMSISNPQFNQTYHQGDIIQMIWNGTGVDHYEICYGTSDTLPCIASQTNIYCDSYGWVILQSKPYTSTLLNWTAPSTINSNTVRVLVEGLNSSDAVIGRVCSGDFSITPAISNQTNQTTTTTTTIPSNATAPQVVYENITEITNIGSNLTETDVQRVIDRLLTAYQQNYTQANLDLAKFKLLFDVSCLYTEDRFQEFFRDYNSLSDTGKACLKSFLTGNVTNSFFFANSCQNLFGNSYYAQTLLDEYLSKGIAERQCQILSFPSYTQTATGFQQSTVQTPVCNYYPSKIPAGCIKRVDSINGMTSNAWDNGFIWGFGIMFAILLIFLVIAIAQASGG